MTLFHRVNDSSILIHSHMTKDKGGRPIEFNKQVVKKLEEVFAMDGTVSEACFYAGISRPTYYSHVNEDAPEDSQAKELFNRFQSLRERPVLKARQTIMKSLDNPDTAKWYLERKKKNEFAVRTEHTGAEGDKLTSIQVEIVQSNATQSESNTDISQD